MALMCAILAPQDKGNPLQRTSPNRMPRCKRSLLLQALAQPITLPHGKLPHRRAITRHMALFPNPLPWFLFMCFETPPQWICPH